MADTSPQAKNNGASTNAATPFPATAGSAIEKTDDEYYCRACFCVDHADHLVDLGHITCSECDSEDVIPLAMRRRELQAEREAFFAAMDAEARS